MVRGTSFSPGREEEEEVGGVVQGGGSLLNSLALSLEEILCGHHQERGTVCLRVHCWGERKRARDESVMENVAIIWGDWMQHVVLDTDIRTCVLMYVCT